MKNNTYCFWLIASTAMGNKPTLEECRILNDFMNRRSR